MAIFNLGSINIDHFYRVPHLPNAGETLAATDYSTGLGGKGANQSVAAVSGGAQVVHIGTIGTDGRWTLERLRGFGVGVDHIAIVDAPTAHAIINVDESGENAIVIFPSANEQQDEARIEAALAYGAEGDFLLLQNETNLVSYTAETAQNLGMQVVYSAAPFDAGKIEEVLPFIDMLVLNEVEAKQLSSALGVSANNLPVAGVLVTMGAEGAEYRTGGKTISVPAFVVDPVDTTGAGDTYLGFFVAGLDAGMDIKGAMTFAAAGAAIQVTRTGTADAIPGLEEVKLFLEENLG